VLAHPWRVLFCGSEDQCASFVAAGALLPFEIATFSENRDPVDRIDAGGTGGPFDVVVAHHTWLAANAPDVVPAILRADKVICLIVEAPRIERLVDSIISDRVMAVPDDHAQALTLAAAMAQKCRVHRLYSEAQASIDATARAAKLVTSEYQRQKRGQEELLNVRNEQFEMAVNNMLHGLCMFDAEQRLVVCNDRYIEMYGLSRETIGPGVSLRGILEHRTKSGSFALDPDKYCEELLATLGRESVSNQLMRTPDGRMISVIHRAMPHGGWVATHEDVTERANVEEQIRHMARHDALTGLSNRTALSDEMEAALTRVHRGAIIAVMCLDLDHFKDVNDTLGHPVGDLLLRAVTERLRAVVRTHDTVARMGGDEFVVLQVSLEGVHDAEALAGRLIASIECPFDLDGHHIVIGASVGVAIAPRDGTTSAELLRNADMALYAAKSDGRGTFRLFEPAMDLKLKAHRQLEADLREALANGEFEIHYQPQVNVATEEIAGCEALLRWNHPTNGLVAPANFIPLAEEIGLIVPIGEWVLREACREATTWPPTFRVAVNLSPAQLKSRNLVQSVLDALHASGLAPGRLELEITETAWLHNDDSTLRTLHELRDLGIKISMDDFGTGYASLSNLHRFPFDKIKIDRSFVENMGQKSDATAIIKAVVWLGKDLGITTVAEGVETSEQLAHVRAFGCTEVQGFLFSPPLPTPALRGFIESHAKSDAA